MFILFFCKKQVNLYLGDYVKKFDIILIVVVAIIAGALYFSGILRPKEEGQKAIVYVDGKVFVEADLNIDNKYDIESNGHHNILEIKDGYANMIDADCPDQLCVKQKKISLKNETIVCLPNKVVIEIEGADSSQLDAVAN